LASFILVKEKQRLKVKWKRLLTTCKRRIPYLCERYSIKSLSEAQKILMLLSRKKSQKWARK